MHFKLLHVCLTIVIIVDLPVSPNSDVTELSIRSRIQEGGRDRRIRTALDDRVMTSGVDFSLLFFILPPSKRVRFIA